MGAWETGVKPAPPRCLASHSRLDGPRNAAAQREGYGNTAPQTQRRREGPSSEGKAREGGGATVTIGDRKIKVSPGFTKAYQELLAAIEANDTANIPRRSLRRTASVRR